MGEIPVCPPLVPDCANPTKSLLTAPSIKIALYLLFTPANETELPSGSNLKLARGSKRVQSVKSLLTVGNLLRVRLSIFVPTDEAFPPFSLVWVTVTSPSNFDSSDNSTVNL